MYMMPAFWLSLICIHEYFIKLNTKYFCVKFFLYFYHIYACVVYLNGKYVPVNTPGNAFLYYRYVHGTYIRPLNSITLFILRNFTRKKRRFYTTFINKHKWGACLDVTDCACTILLKIEYMLVCVVYMCVQLCTYGYKRGYTLYSLFLLFHLSIPTK